MTSNGDPREGVPPQIDPEILRSRQILKDARRKTVVFASFTMTARHVREALSR